MRIKLFIIFFLYCCIPDVNAQKTKYFTINPGEKISEVIPDSDKYTYPAFTTGAVYFRDSRKATAKMNYNSLFEEIIFINPAGDTLALDNAPTISYVVIGADTFYFDNTFVKHIASYGEIKFAGKECFAIANINKVGAMDQVTPGSIETIKSVYTGTDSKELVIQQVLKVRKETLYYFGDRSNNFKIANRKNLFDLFPGKTKKVKNYFKNNSVNFFNESDLKKMIIFLQAN